MAGLDLEEATFEGFYGTIVEEPAVPAELRSQGGRFTDPEPSRLAALVTLAAYAILLVHDRGEAWRSEARAAVNANRASARAFTGPVRACYTEFIGRSADTGASSPAPPQPEPSTPPQPMPSTPLQPVPSASPQDSLGLLRRSRIASKLGSMFEATGWATSERSGFLDSGGRP